jgi:hypothetical protein
MIFRRNPVDALAKQRTLLAGDEQKIAELQRERAAALVETEGVAEIEELDQRIAALRRACSIHHDRISALEMQVRAEAHEKLEQRRLTAVKTIEKKLAARTAVAAELEASIKKTGDLFFALLNSPGIGADWPFGHVPGAAVDVDAVRREVGWAAFSAGRPSGGRTIYPPPQNSGLGIGGVHAIGVAAVVANQSNALLSLLREMPLGEDEAAYEGTPAESVPGPHGLAGLATA